MTEILYVCITSVQGTAKLYSFLKVLLCLAWFCQDDKVDPNEEEKLAELTFW